MFAVGSRVWQLKDRWRFLSNCALQGKQAAAAQVGVGQDACLFGSISGGSSLLILPFFLQKLWGGFPIRCCICKSLHFPAQTLATDLQTPPSATPVSVDLPRAFRCSLQMKQLHTLEKPAAKEPKLKNNPTSGAFS